MSNKFPGFCIDCGKKVGAGHGKLTKSGNGAWVVSCGASGSASGAKSKSPRSSGRKTTREPRKAGACEKADGIVVGSTRRLGERDASLLVGKVFRAGRGWGDLTGKVVTVVGAETWYESSEMNEDAGDMQGGGWGATRYVRLATDEEAAPVADAETSRQEKDARAKRTKEIARDVLERGRKTEQEAEKFEFDLATKEKPEAEGWNWDRRSGTIGGVLVVRGDVVFSWDSGHYDDYRRSLGSVEDAALAAEVRELRAKSTQS